MATVAIVSDIHANLVALDAVMAELARIEPDQVVCLGDVAATGPAPREVMARLRTLNWRFVRGNCDDALLAYASGANRKAVEPHDEIDRWCASRLEPEDLALLADFEPVVTIDAGGLAICCYHGSPRSNLDEILPSTPDEALDRWLDAPRAAIYAGGHTHLPMLRRHREAYVINPGSVGLPFTYTADGNSFNPAWAEFAVVDVGDGHLRIELVRTPVDRTALIDSARRSGMPRLDWWGEDWR